MGNQEITLVHSGSLYHYFFKDYIDVKQCCAKSEIELSNYIMDYSCQEFNVVYLVYIGHGDGSDMGKEYPQISPFETIDIVNLSLKNKNNESIKFRTILDCCNVGDIELRKHPETTGHQPESSIGRFFGMDFDYISMVRGLEGNLFGNRTTFNESLFESLLNYKFESFEELLSIFNFIVGKKYKEQKMIRNNRIKKFISCSQRFNSSISKDNIVPNSGETVELPEDYIINESNCQKLKYIDYHSRRKSTKTIFGSAIDKITIS